MAKAAKSKLPKKVAGFKVPKGLRKSGMLDTLVGSQTGRQLLADALIAAASAAAAVLVKGRGDAAGGNGKTGGGRSLMSDATHAATGALATFVTEAAHGLISGGAGRSDDAQVKGQPRRRPASPRVPAEQKAPSAET